jgi:hypothetical protein
MFLPRLTLCVTVLSLLAVLARAADNSLDEAFAAARYNFDVTQAELLLPQYEKAMVSEANEQAIIDFASASLLVAELNAALMKRALSRERPSVSWAAKLTRSPAQHLPPWSKRPTPRSATAWKLIYSGL